MTGCHACCLHPASGLGRRLFPFCPAVAARLRHLGHHLSDCYAVLSSRSATGHRACHPCLFPCALAVAFPLLPCCRRPQHSNHSNRRCFANCYGCLATHGLSSACYCGHLSRVTFLCHLASLCCQMQRPHLLLWDLWHDLGYSDRLGRDWHANHWLRAHPVKPHLHLPLVVPHVAAVALAVWRHQQMGHSHSVDYPFRNANCTS
mmetsp:Transcript_45989/g.106951  ORF Transcript_45989/g.106951 Transcript_45989/m.106951 type:complete len:204 (-) Transcript_45989:50-661(-)